jgi:hypothetical protein
MINELQLVTRRKFLITVLGLCSSFVGGCKRNKAEEDSLNPMGIAEPKASSFLGEVPLASQSCVDVIVRPMVKPIKQTSSSTCWASVYAMMLSWKTGKTIATREAVTSLGPEWAAHFDRNEGLESQTFTEDGFLKVSELRAMPPANYLPSVYVELLASHGPVWVNTGDGILNHARILVGARTLGDGQVTFLFIDPNGGKFTKKSETEFFAEFEKEARVIVDQNLKWDLRFQIFYW